MLNPEVVSTDRDRLIRLRKLQLRITADINALALSLSETGPRRPTADQWATLWSDLEAVRATLQKLTEQLLAGQSKIKRRRRKAGESTAKTENVL